MKFLQGLILTIHTAIEVPMLFFSGKIFKKYGPSTVMNSILFLMALKAFFYGHMISPWQVVLIEWLHGIIFALNVTNLTTTVFQISPENLTATTIASAYFMKGIGNVYGLNRKRTF